MTDVLWILLVGVGATLAMDAWALFLRTVFGMASLDYALVGRWIGHLAQGRVAHPHIGQATPIAGERWLGWTAHYAIGIAFAGLLWLFGGADWMRQPTPWLAIAIGVGAIAAPFFIMQPAFGFGIAAAKLPNPNVARLRSLMTHLTFGIGLYLSALLVAATTPLA